MKRLVLVMLVVFLASNAYGVSSGWTPVTTDSSWVTSWKDAEGGLFYRIALPCSIAGGATGAVIDSFVTWPMVITRYQAISVGYYCDTIGGYAPPVCSVEIGYEQSFLKDDSTFATPQTHGLLETAYRDTTGTFTWQEVYPMPAMFIRFYIRALTGHDISPSGKIYFYIHLSKSPMSYMKQGGPIKTSKLSILSAGTGNTGKRSMDFWFRDNEDTLVAQMQGGGGDRRTVWDNPFYVDDTFQPIGLTLMNRVGSRTEWSMGTRCNPNNADTLRITATDSLIPTRIFHRVGAAATDWVAASDDVIMAIEQASTAPIYGGGFFWITPATQGDTIYIAHYDTLGGTRKGNIFCGSQGDTIALSFGDMMSFYHFKDASYDIWLRMGHWDNGDDVANVW